MSSRMLATLLLSIALTAGVAGPTSAQHLVDPRNRDNPSQAGGISLDRAVRMAETRYRARAVKAETIESDDGRRIHEIRLLNAEGKVWKVRIDADTGQAY